MATRRLVGNILITLGLLLIAAALALVVFNIQEERQAGNASADALAQMQEAAAPVSDARPASDADAPMPAVEVGGRLYVGTLAVPSLGLELPVLADWSYEGLDVAPCRYSGSAYAGDLVICGHNYQTHFAQLENVDYDAEVLFTDMQGNVFRYQVASVETLDAAAVEDMVDSDYELSLFTCNFSGTARVTVRCVQV